MLKWMLIVCKQIWMSYEYAGTVVGEGEGVSDNGFVRDASKRE
jgi:hypothetical protein